MTLQACTALSAVRLLPANHDAIWQGGYNVFHTLEKQALSEQSRHTMRNRAGSRCALGQSACFLRPFLGQIDTACSTKVQRPFRRA